jgi:hypothetical protein
VIKAQEWETRTKVMEEEKSAEFKLAVVEWDREMKGFYGICNHHKHHSPCLPQHNLTYNLIDSCPSWNALNKLNNEMNYESIS